MVELDSQRLEDFNWVWERRVRRVEGDPRYAVRRWAYRLAAIATKYLGRGPAGPGRRGREAQELTDRRKVVLCDVHEATCATSWGAVRAELTRVMVRIECSAISFPGAALGSGPRCPCLGLRCSDKSAGVGRRYMVPGTYLPAVDVVLGFSFVWSADCPCDISRDYGIRLPGHGDTDIARTV